MPDNLLDGARELLLETVSTLDKASIGDYLVIGGWCPYLRNKSGLRHPGTLDVDLLFRAGDREGALSPAIDALLNAGFVLSAKHSFQLLFEKAIRGKRLIYNVDLLHPSMSAKESEMFVDHLDLDIPLAADGDRVKKSTSIILPNSKVLFDEELFSEYSLCGVSIRLVDFTGMFLTKMDSCQKAKRERDSFDIYVGLRSESIEFAKIERIAAQNLQIQQSLDRLRSYLESQGRVFNENVQQFFDDSSMAPESPAEALLLGLRSIS